MYGMREVAKLLRMPSSMINSLVKAGFVSPARGPRNSLRFSFRDLIVLRTAQALAAAKVPPKRITRSIRELRRRFGAHIYREYGFVGAHPQDAVRPAMEEIRDTLEKRGFPARIVEGESGDGNLALNVVMADDQDFTYEVWPVRGTMPAFAVRPQQTASDYYRAEVHLFEGSQGYDVLGYTKEQIGEIVHILLRDVRDRLAEEQMTLKLTPDAIDFLVDKGYDEKFGARPLKRAIQRYLEDPLSEKILMAEFSAGSRNWSRGSAATGTLSATPSGITRCRRWRSSLSDCGRPPENGSSTSTPPRRRSRTRKWPGTDTPSRGSPTRRPISMYRIESVSGMPVLRSITSLR